MKYEKNLVSNNTLLDLLEVRFKYETKKINPENIVTQQKLLVGNFKSLQYFEPGIN